jgi:hypothetical protein
LPDWGVEAKEGGAHIRGEASIAPACRENVAR